MKKLKVQKVCPNCGSPYIEYASLRRESGSIIGLGIPEKYYCDKCGYVGSVILEMTPAQRKKRKFSKKAYKPPKRYGRAKSAEALKPIFLIVMVLFFIAAFVLFFPKYEVLKQYDLLELPTAGSTTGVISPAAPVAFTESGEEVYWFGQQYIMIKQTGLQDIENALGYPNVLDFLVPLFLTFFVTGFIMMMIVSHWHRIRLFNY